ncbi:MAG: DUF1045 domain-containing protein [Thermodesulfobacteriota bacterium]|nr:DUF1045 domain-containing protein [Thermodesulfobacteriota bacterium]
MRFALYYAPSPSSLLWELGSRWLGYDALGGERIRQVRCSGLDPERLYEITLIPRRYGLHATLKPPFRLAADSEVEMLRLAISDFTSRRTPFVLPPLSLRRINDFFCLGPEKQTRPLAELASECVLNFDRFRAPLTTCDLARRSINMLTPVEKHNLITWGYPYVLEQFRFHITLTSRITDAAEKEVIHTVLSEMFAPVLGVPLVMDAICLFVEPASGQPFVCVERFPFQIAKQTLEEFSLHDRQNQQQNLYSRHQRHPA